MNCEKFYYSGLSDCEELFKDVIGMEIVDKGQSFSDISEMATHTAIFAGKDSQTGMYLPVMRGYQNNTSEPERNTTQVGFTEKTSDPLPMLVGFLDRSYCDYKTLFGIDGKEKDVVLFLKNGKIWNSKDTDGNDIGFRAKISIRKNAPLADNSVEAYPIYVDFKYVEDMDNAVLNTLNFSAKELVDNIPVGLTISVSTAYTAGVVNVHIDKRCTQTPYAGATSVDYVEVLKKERGSTDLDVAATAIDATSAELGDYAITIKKDASGTPADLTKGVWIRVAVDDGSKLTYVSAPIFIKVA